MQQKPITFPRGAIIQGQNGERYLIEDLLGRGGASIVYLARDRGHKGQMFALKELINPDTEERGHVAFEAELLMRLEHPALPHIYKVFENVKLQRVYVVMDYITGKNLEALREEQPEKRFSLSHTLALLKPVVDAVSYLHTQNPPVVHRDIKPGNIIVTAGMGGTVLVDFGIAKEYTTDRTTSLFRYGTPGYAAPEQYGQGTNPRTDIYALAATFYTLLTGSVPTDALARSVNREQDDFFKPVHYFCPQLPRAVSHVIERAMSLRSEERYATIGAFWQDLISAATQPVQSEPAFVAPKMFSPSQKIVQEQQRQVLIDATTSGGSEPPIHSLSRRRTSRPKILFLYGLLILAVIIGSILFATRWLYAGKPMPIVQHSQATLTMHVTDCPLPSFAPHAPITPLYIQTNPAYQGEISDNVATISTKNHGSAMCLTDVRQKDDKISGEFSGLGFINAFDGTVTQDGVHFSIAIGSERVYDFEGGVRSGGDMAGTYKILDKAGQDLGEGGVWEVVPVKGGK